MKVCRRLLHPKSQTLSACPDSGVLGLEVHTTLTPLQDKQFHLMLLYTTDFDRKTVVRSQGLYLVSYIFLTKVLPVLFVPGDLTLPSHARKYRLSLDDCSSLHSVTTIEDTEGIISGLAGTNISSGIRYDCRWRIVVPQHRYLVMAASVLGPQGPCSSSLLWLLILITEFRLSPIKWTVLGTSPSLLFSFLGLTL